MTKSEVRKLMLERRRELSPAQLHTASEAIAARFLRLAELATAKVIHSFLPILKFNEINTNLIITRIRETFRGIRTAAPKSDLADGTLRHFFFDESTRFEENKWGISEPADGEPVSPAEIDLVIVPLLGFDLAGHRVGYGKGFYDRFLAECRKDCLKVGISLFPPVEKIDDTNENDVRLDYCLTPDSLIEF